MSRMNELLSIITANSDESIDDLLVMMAPENNSKEEIQETFENLLGYDPTTYFDKKIVNDQIDDITMSNDTPEDIVTSIEDSKEDIINETIDDYENKKHAQLKESLYQVLEDRFGWCPQPDDGEDDSEDDDDDDSDDDF